NCLHQIAAGVASIDDLTGAFQNVPSVLHGVFDDETHGVNVRISHGLRAPSVQLSAARSWSETPYQLAFALPSPFRPVCVALRTWPHAQCCSTEASSGYRNSPSCALAAGPKEFYAFNSEAGLVSNF